MLTSELNRLKELTYTLDHKNVVYLYGFNKTSMVVMGTIYYEIQLAMYWERGGSLKKLYDGITEKNIRFGGRW